MEVILTSFTQRREIREEINRRVSLWMDHCRCGGPQPGYDDLKLDQHSADCGFVNLMEERETVCTQS